MRTALAVLTSTCSAHHLRLNEDTMPIQCPSCGSTHIIARHMGRKVAATAGGIAATASGVAGLSAGAKTGMAGGPVTMTLGSLPGAIIGGLIGCVTGSLASSKIGDRLDEGVLDNGECTHCGTTFRIE